MLTAGLPSSVTSRAVIIVYFFSAGKWKEMKPKSGALKHAGLKWERVKVRRRDVTLAAKIAALRLQNHKTKQKTINSDNSR